MVVSRRDFLKASSALAAAFGWNLGGGADRAEAAAADGLSVIWLQAQGCSGCSVSLLNSISIASVADLLTTTLNMEYHSTLMAAAGAKAVAQAAAAMGKTGYVLAVDGGVSTGAGGQYCTLWPGLTALDGVKQFAQNAKYVLAIGSCASFRGMCAGSPNPTGVQPLSGIVGTTKLINVPGCPAHPDWIVGTIAWLIRYGTKPSLDSQYRPKMYYGKKVHDLCPYREQESRCLKEQGCRGPQTFADCPTRKWNAAQAGGAGVNWCVGAGRPYGTPCHGCTESRFPDGMSPFFREGDDEEDRSLSTQSAPEADSPVETPQPTKSSKAPRGREPEIDLRQMDDGPSAGQGRAKQQQTKKAEYERLKQERRRQYEARKGGADHDE